MRMLYMALSYLYKVLSIKNWKSSQKSEKVALDSHDDAFIHLSTEEQLDRITSKFWAEELEYVILKLDAKKLKGRLVFESNPGGTNKYYHLYEGSIPKEAVVDAKIVTRRLQNSR